MQFILFFFNLIFIKGRVRILNRVIKNNPVMRNVRMILI
jgi:hypothetical protein